MLKTYASRVAAGAVVLAGLTAGSLGLTATAAAAGGVSASAARAHAGTSTAINCPPPSISDPGNGGC